MSAAGAPPAGARPKPPSQAKRNVSIVLVLLVAAWAAFSVDVRYDRILDLPAGLWRIVHRMFFVEGPAWDYAGVALEHMVTSIQIAWVGTIIGAVFSLPIGFLAAKNVSGGWVANALRQLLNAIRAFPELVLAVAIFIPIAGLGPVAGALAIGIHSIGTLGKLTAEVVEGIDSGPVEAARAVGGRGLQVQRWGVLPQVLPEIIAFWLYRFEINVRAAAILGVVGAGGIGFILEQTIRFTRFPEAGMAIIVVVVATIFVDNVSGFVRRRIIEGADRKIEHAEIFEQPEMVERPV
ncbi:MAG TPA: phosphonate ABC transporter, permease protein PhnE [Candidatus Limnocylindria bacterium]|nr:phosphonate ABC transporter, permease protein PhnE [Candidatus Limnocylindria bacterium]